VAPAVVVVAVVVAAAKQMIDVNGMSVKGDG
jgi:hypothetical protein